MKKLSLFATMVVALLSLLTLGASRASADTIVFQLTSDHCTGTNGCIPIDGASAGTVTITDGSSGVVTVNVTLNEGFQFVSTGFEADFGFNLNGDPSVTFSAVSSNFEAGSSHANTFTAQNPETAGILHMDGTGEFEYGVVCTGCGNGGGGAKPGPLTFTIT